MTLALGCIVLLLLDPAWVPPIFTLGSGAPKIDFPPPISPTESSSWNSRLASL